MLRFVLTSFCLTAIIASVAQTRIGEWRDHFPYDNIIDIIQGNQKIYAATPEGVFSVDLDENNLERLSKLNGLSDIGISTIQFHESSSSLIVGYANGNIDVVVGNKTTNMPDILRSSIIGDKGIYHFNVVGDRAYVSTGFGIVVLDIINKEFDDTYIYGPDGTQIKTNATAVNSTHLFAATDNGIYKASVSGSNLLSDFNSWSKDSTIPNTNGVFNEMVEFNDYIIVNYDSPNFREDTLYYFDNISWKKRVDHIDLDFHQLIKCGDKIVGTNNFGAFVFDSNDLNLDYSFTYSNSLTNLQGMVIRCSYIDNRGNHWAGDKHLGLFKVTVNGSIGTRFSPNGPVTASTRKLSIVEEELWLAPGTIAPSNWSGKFNTDGFSNFSNESWSYLAKTNTEGLDTVFDVISVAIDSSNSKRVFLGSWSEGLLEIVNGQIVKHYYKNNSALEGRTLAVNSHLVGVSDMSFDESGNLWVLNPPTNNPLKVLKTDGTWESYSFSYISDSEILTDLLIDNNGYKWMPESKGKGLVVLNDKGTFSSTDDESKLLTTTAGNGGLPSSVVYSIAKDLDGEVWLGTGEGIAVFYSPENIFSSSNFDAQQILIEQDGNIEILMKNEIVTAIAVDGANRKWLGTDAGGAFLVSADGTEQIYNFTEENSPLISNEISDIAINHITGEVFFATSKGIVSFRSTATQAELGINELTIYPNPIRPNYSGQIAIKGLVLNTNVKITDASGNVVFETISEGGQAIWNGRNFNGEKVNTGVYFVFATTSDGKQTGTGKLLYYR